MWRTAEEILDAFKVTDYVHQHHAYNSGETIGFIDRDGSAIWWRLHPGSFWYFDGRTDAGFLHKQTRETGIWRCWWKRRERLGIDQPVSVKMIDFAVGPVLN